MDNPTPKPGFWARFAAFMTGEGIADIEAATETPTTPVQPPPTPAAFSLPPDQLSAMATTLVDAACPGAEPAKKAGLIQLATAALMADGGKIGEHCAVFKSFASERPPLDMTTPGFALNTASPDQVKAAKELQVLRGAVGAYNNQGGY